MASQSLGFKGLVGASVGSTVLREHVASSLSLVCVSSKLITDDMTNVIPLSSEGESR